MTIKQAAAELKLLNITLRKQDNNYLVNITRGSEATATVHDNLSDAYETGKAMAHISRAYTFQLS
jgi:hypothetical protein